LELWACWAKTLLIGSSDVFSLAVEATRQRECPRKIWRDYVKDDVKSTGPTCEDGIKVIGE